MRHPANSWAVAVPVAAALAIGLGATALFDPASAGVAVVALLEPFLLAVGLFGLAACLLSGARAIAGGLGVGLLLGFLALHNPGRLRLAEAELPGWSNQLRDCALVASSQPQPFRLLWWQVDGSPSPSALFTLLDARPDVVVLDGLSDPKLLDALGAELPGETLWLTDEEPGGPMGVAVRGSFQYCGGETDRWHLDLPGGHAGAVMLLPQIEQRGLLPLVLVHGPRSPLDGGSRRFASDTRDAIAALRALTLQLGPRGLLILGDLRAPQPFLDGAMEPVGLTEVSLPPSWPMVVGPLPGLPLVPEARLWRGEGWVVRSVERMASGDAASAPLLMELSPR
jgi:hypothetical protein